MQSEQGCNVVNLGIDADIDLGIPVPPTPSKCLGCGLDELEVVQERSKDAES